MAITVGRSSSKLLFFLSVVLLHTSVGEYCFQVYCTSVPDFAHNGAYFLTGFFMNQLLVEQVVEIAIESTTNLVKWMSKKKKRRKKKNLMALYVHAF